jgi:hypothetical protein
MAKLPRSVVREVGTKPLGTASPFGLALMGHQRARTVATPTAPKYDAPRKLTGTRIREPRKLSADGIVSTRRTGCATTGENGYSCYYQSCGGNSHACLTLELSGSINREAIDLSA